jgi:hypothetical protein
MRWPFRMMLVGAALAALTTPLQAQSPIGKEFPFYSGPDGAYDPDVVYYPDGRFLVAFKTVDGNGDDSLWVQRYSLAGNPSGPVILVRQGIKNHLTDTAGIRLIPEKGGGFWSVWYEMLLDRFGLSARRFSAAGEPLADEFPLAEEPRFFPISAILVEDRLIVLGRRFDSDTSRPGVAEFDSTSGALLGGFAVDQPYPFAQPLALFLDSPQTLSVAWWTATGDPQTSGAWARRFNRDGTAIDPPLLLNRRAQPGWSEAQVARDGEGNLVAVWQATDRDGPYEDIYAQRFSAAGERIGRIFGVNTVRLSAQRYPSVAADRSGNFVVAWQSFDPALGSSGWHLRAQLFRKDGRRVGREIVIPNPGGDNDTWEPKAIFGPNGTFLLHYVAAGPVMIRRYAASPGDEPCVWRGNAVRCDTGRTGGEAEIPKALAVLPGDVPLLGDVDGDGRADPCVRRGRRFLCDVDHEGGTWEWQVTFGQGGEREVPLMADVDGDGRAEACVRSGRQFQCDTAHDGGKAEWTATFGEPGDPPLLGDVDGDGRADPCVFRAGQFLCRGLTVTFGQPGDLPVLGDFDGDGRADPCVFRAGQFLCDTAHDGGAAEGRLLFGSPGDRPLLGNLDGL